MLLPICPFHRYPAILTHYYWNNPKEIPIVEGKLKLADVYFWRLKEVTAFLLIGSCHHNHNQHHQWKFNSYIGGDVYGEEEVDDAVLYCWLYAGYSLLELQLPGLRIASPGEKHVRPGAARKRERQRQRQICVCQGGGR